MKKYIIILIVLAEFIVLQISAQEPQARFSVEQSGNCTPVSVSFINTSQGDSLEYHWNLGNGNTSELENPQAIYNHAGNYSVTLIVSNSQGIDSLIIEDAVMVYAKPDINLTKIGNEAGCVPFQRSFAVESTNQDNVEYQWDFGTGTIFQGNSVNVNFENNGEYDLLLTAINEYTCVTTKYYETVAEAYSNPVFQISANMQSFCQENPEVNFSLHTDDILETHEWSFGDNTFSTNLNPSHIYTSDGSFDVSCTVSNQNNCSASITEESMIEIAPVVADFLPEDSVFCSRTIQFQNLSKAYRHVRWDFGDGATSNQVNPQHEFSEPGIYTVNLRVWNDDGCEDEINKEIILDFVIADFTISDNSFCELPAFIQYTSQSENAVSWEYHLGNGQIFNMQNPINYLTDSIFQNSFDMFANLNDTLIATSQYGCVDTIVKLNNIEVNQPRAYFTPNDLPGNIRFARGCVPFTVNFNEASVYNNLNDEIVSYHWNFGDGSSSNLQNPNHTWNQVGEYEVKLTVETEGGCSNTFKTNIEVGSPQTADFSLMVEDTVCASEYVQLINNSSDNTLIDQWIWNFSDGGVSMSPNPSYHFVDTGYMDISLVVGYNGCMSEPTVMTNALYVSGPVAEFTYQYNCENPLVYHFSGDVTEADYWYWDLGDGTTGYENETEFSYEYAESGNYQVQIISENYDNACQYNYRRTLKPRDLKAIISVDTIYGCPGLTVHADGEQSLFTIPAEHANSWGKYHWIIEDANIDTVLNTGLTHQFNTPGTHEIKLIVKDRNGCVDTASQVIRVFGVTGQILIDNQIGCTPLSVNYSSNIISDTSIVAWQWNFDDGLSSNEETPSHIYTTGGNFNPELLITDALGCESLIELDDIIVSIQPSSDFSVSKRGLCIGDEVTFEAEHQENNSIYQWTFGNGETAQENQADVQYVNVGDYDVSLFVQDSNQCTNQLTKSEYISVEDYPIANFIADSLSSVCYPFEVGFLDNSSEHVTNWNWNFGNNETISDIENPTYTYVQPGVFDVSLIVSTENGCSDTLVREAYIEVGGPSADIIAPDTACKGNVINLSLDNELNIYSATWDMGNGQFINGMDVSYSYNQAGSFNPVVLLESDANGSCSKAFEFEIEIPLVKAIFIEKSSGLCLGEQMELNNQSIGANCYQWNFGDGNFSIETEPVHIYTAPGTYENELIAKFVLENGSTCADTSTNQVEVFPKPVSNFSYNIENPQVCTLPKSVSFRNESLGADTYQWIFESNRPTHAVSDVENPDYLYHNAGDHLVKLISTNQYSCSDTIIKSVEILPIVEANFEASETVGCEPLSVNFNNLTSYDENSDRIVSTNFFINGEPVSNENISLTHGNYDVTMITETANGCLDSMNVENMLLVHQAPKAKFSMQANDNLNHPEGYGKVQFQNESNANTSSYDILWNFGDGYQSEEINPTHRYNAYSDFSGEAFQAILTITNKNGCTDRKIQSVSMDYFNGLFVPNAIMPQQGIGEQQLFLPKGKSLSSYHLTIYNRNGKLIFESSALDPIDGSPVDAWNGTINGQYADQGVYVWQIEAEFTDGSTWSYKTKSGKSKNTGTFLVIR
ncbi:MAG: PKD domain-containing protein [Bacteroidales bacterium]|jgi:PKD repeat protein|nr:PKD domain-containing protein [Bacteroidales bacterium]